MDEIVIRPRWFRNLPLGLCLLSILMLALVVATGPADLPAWLWWLAVILLLWVVAFWARAALRTWVRGDDSGVRSERPMSRLTASTNWEEVERFVFAAGAVKAEVGDDEPVVVLDRSGCGRWISERLEHERARRQDAPSA